MEIYISRNGQQFGPYSLDDVNAYLASGELNAEDMAWHDGLADWLPLRSIEGVNAPRPAASARPALPSATSVPALYKPVHATTGTIFFTMIWGAAITRSNWLALNKPKEAGRSLILIWGGVVFYVLLGILDIPGNLVTWLIPVVVWYLADYKGQAKFIKATYGDAYPKRSYGKPVLIGFVLLAALVALAMFGEPSQAPPPK